MPYQHFTIEERESIQLGLWGKQSIRTIATVLNRSASSVSRELRRHYPPQVRRYAPRLAHLQALAQRKSRGRKDRLKNQAIRSYVITHLKQGWSPEQISGRIRLELDEHISHEVIYQFIYAQIYRQGYGYLKPQGEDLRQYLRRKQKRRQRQGLRKSQYLSYPRPSIDLRPQVVASRQRFGDWEGDTVESTNHQPGLNTLVERKCGLLFMTKVQDKTSASTAQVVLERLHHLPLRLKQTLTLDNGPENSAWPTIELHTGIKCFFAHPYHS